VQPRAACSWALDKASDDMWPS